MEIYLNLLETPYSKRAIPSTLIPGFSMLILLAERLGIGFSVWIKEFFAAFLPCGLNLWGGASPKCAMTAEAGGRNVDQMRQPCCKEDGGRPSGGGLQDQ